MQTNLIEFYKQTGTFTDAGRFKDDLIELWEQKCNRSLKKLCLYLMNVTLHRVILQLGIKGNKLDEYGDFSYIDYTTPMSEDDLFLTANAMLGEIYRRDSKGFYIGRHPQTRINVTCRYVSILTSAILKANGIACRSRVGWARYLGPLMQNHWINEYYSTKEKRWIMFDLDDLYDAEYTDIKMYRENKISEEYLDIKENQFYTAAKAWIEFRKDNNFIKDFRVLSENVDAYLLVQNIFLDFFALFNLEYHYYSMPIAFDKKSYTEADFTELDALAKLMLEPNKNFEKLKEIFEKTPKFRMLTSPLVRKTAFEELIKTKKYKID